MRAFEYWRGAPSEISSTIGIFTSCARGVGSCDGKKKDDRNHSVAECVELLTELGLVEIAGLARLSNAPALIA
jgi:hypothetical protein